MTAGREAASKAVGLALVVVKSNRDAGDILLKVSSPGMADAVLNIKTNTLKNL